MGSKLAGCLDLSGSVHFTLVCSVLFSLEVLRIKKQREKRNMQSNFESNVVTYCVVYFFIHFVYILIYLYTDFVIDIYLLYLQYGVRTKQLKR